MADRLKNKVAVVTGAGSQGPGIGNGKAAAVLFAREGASVLCVDLVEERAAETVALIADEHARTQLVAHGADVLKLSYRMLNPEGKEAESFDVWAKLPSPAALTADEPIVPLAFEFKPRTYPRLKARQVLGAAPPPTLTVAGCGGGVGKREGGPR